MKKLSLLIPLVALSVNAQTVSKSQMAESLDALSDPQKLAPDAKDCTPEEKLAIDCRAHIEKSQAYFKNLKEQVSEKIKFQQYELEQLLKKANVKELGELHKEYLAAKKVPNSHEIQDPKEKKKALQANQKATKKVRSEMFKKLKIAVNPDYNCFLGPDGFYVWEPKRGKCTSGFTNVDPYEVTTNTLEEDESGVLDLKICRKIQYEPYSFQLCGTKSVEHGATWLDTNGATRAVTLIKEVEGKKVGGAKNKFFVKGQTLNFFEPISDMVDREIQAKHKKCVPFLPPKL